jgi:excisionase family DNA binding protein
MSTQIEVDKLLTAPELCDLLRVKMTYVYWLTHQRKIPFIKMQGHLRFRKSDIDNWLKSQEIRNVHTQKEIQERS